MHYNYELSIIVPGIRSDQWDTLWEHCKFACKRFKYEMIFSGPNPLTPNLQKDYNVKYIKSLGTPTRAMHMAMLLAEGRFATWIADDAHLYPDSIDLAIDLLLSKNPQKDLVAMRYTEGPNHSGAEFAPSYWIAGTHPDLHCPKVNRTWKIPLVPLIAVERYKELGGIDCDLEHLNMNVIDFGFRAQMDGSVVHMSPTQVQNCDFELNRTAESHPVIAAFWENDRPKFWAMYDENSNRPIKIDIENWRNTPPVWSRRFK